MIKVGLAGVGRRGSRILDRLLYMPKDSEVPELRVVGVHDKVKSYELETNAEKKKIFEAAGGQWFDSYHDLLKKSDAMIIATSPSSHFELAQMALENGKDVLLEKPSTLCHDHDCTLENRSKSSGRILAVGYSERFNPVAQKAKNEINFHDVHLYTSYRLNWPQPKGEDPGVEFDLMSHCIDLGNWYFGMEPRFVHIASDGGKSFMELSYGSADAHLVAGLVKETEYRYRVAQLFGKKSFYYLDYAQQEYQEFKAPKIPEDWKSRLNELTYEQLLHMSRNVENKSTLEKEPLTEMLSCFAKSVQSGEITSPLCPISESKTTTKTIEEALFEAVKQDVKH